MIQTGKIQTDARNPAVAASPFLRWFKRVGWLLVALAFLALGNAISNNLKDYYQDIILQCGFAIILAVSLNIVNGLTGQFSIGHAGFMAAGAYTGASVTYQVALHENGMSQSLALQWMLLAMAAGWPVRRACRVCGRRSESASARRLPGDSHAWLWGNHSGAAGKHLPT